MVLKDEVFTYTPEMIKNMAAAKIFELMNTLFIGAAVIFALYVVNAIAMTVIARKMKFPCPAVAWIPLASPYIEGRLFDSMRSDDLKKSNTRMHYLMLNIAYVALCAGAYFYSFSISMNQCIEMYNTGALPLSIMSGTPDPTYTAVYAVMSVLAIVVTYFRSRTLFMAHVCFDKKKGMFLSTIVSIFIPALTPFFYFSLSKLTPVNKSIDKISTKFI